MSYYVGQDFWHFFWVLGQRLSCVKQGPLASDEVQLLVLIPIAISCAIIGSFLVLRKMTMLANALSHTVLLGIVVTYLLFPSVDGTLSFSALMGAALLSGFLTTAFTSGLQRAMRLQEDASIGLVFSFLFALAVMLISCYARNAHIGLELIMGNADALVFSDISFAQLILLLNVVFLFVFFRGYQITTFDAQMAKSIGFSPLFYTYLLMTQTSFTTISAFRCIGVFMVLAFLVVPPLMARLLVHSLKKLIALSCVLAVFAVVIGVAVSRHVLTCYHLGISTGAVIVTCLFLLFLTLTVCKLTFSRRALYYS